MSSVGVEDPKKLEEGSHHEKPEATATELSVDENKTTTNDNGGENPILLKKTSKRVATLDAFRGLTIVVSSTSNY